MNLLETAKEVALEAGALLKKGFGTHFKMDTKEVGRQNLVTEYDIASQKLILDRMSKAFPSHHFLAEEGNVKAPPSDEILWIIDPLDGTVNFAHGVPIFAVSIAAARGKEILAGVVYHPMLGELFLCERGSGAYCGEKRLFVTARKTFENTLLGTGFPYNIDENPLDCIGRFGKMAKRGIPLRRLGCASIDLAYVAAGRYDLFWEVGLEPWDIAAGKLLVEEAGGKVTQYDGSEHPLYPYISILASNGHLHDQMVELLKEDLS